MDEIAARLREPLPPHTTSPVRAYVHPPEEMLALLSASGFVPVSDYRTVFWRTAVPQAPGSLMAFRIRGWGDKSSGRGTRPHWPQPTLNRPILVAVAWPYASGSLHLGHLAGAYLPADIFARYHRLAGNRVLMVSGSDGHGTPITVAADKEGVSPKEIVDRYHPEILGYWESLGISFDLFTTTLTDNHREVTWDIFRAHRRGGTIVEGESLQFYDPQAERFLPDRYVEGTCPHCGYTRRGDQCDNCGRTLDPIDLLNPRSRLSGATHIQRATKHWFLRLGVQRRSSVLARSQSGLAASCQKLGPRHDRRGLPDRAITRPHLGRAHPARGRHPR